MAERFENRDGHRTGGAVAGINDEAQRANGSAALHDHGAVRLQHRTIQHVSDTLDEDPGLDPASQVLDLLTVKGGGTELQLETVEFDRIVAAGDHHTGIGRPGRDGVVDRRGGHHSGSEDRQPGGDQSPGPGILQAR